MTLEPSPAQNLPPEWLLLEDGPLLAVNKPDGLPTEAAADRYESMVGLVKSYLRSTYGKTGNVYLGIPHRLDRASTGVLVMTRNSKTAARVAEQFEQRAVRKIYWALLERVPQEPAGELIDWLWKVPDEARSQVVPAETPQSKEARLRYRTLATLPQGELVEVELLTGRMHQIRVQFASRGCPIVGDVKYGAGPGFWISEDASQRAVAADDDDVRIALHARSLTLKHPIRYDDLIITAPVPGYWNLPADFSKTNG